MNTLKNEGDKIREGYGHQFLVKYGYPEISNAFITNTDKDTQIAGVDVCVTGLTNIPYTVDEKIVSNYCNTYLPTGVMELSSLTMNERNKIGESTGWYFTASAATFIAYMYIDKATTVKPNKNGEPRILDGSGITETTIYFIHKAKLQEELDKVGWTKEKIIERTNEIRKLHPEPTPYEKPVKYEHLNKWCRFCVETSAQHSINLQFSRDYLKKFSNVCKIEKKEDGSYYGTYECNGKIVKEWKINY